MIGQHFPEIQDKLLNTLQLQAQDQIDLLWDNVSFNYMELKVAEQPEVDPKYKFDPEWQEFWDIAEKLYPEYILKHPF